MKTILKNIPEADREAVETHQERTELHNEGHYPQFALNRNEGKAWHKASGPTDYSGTVLVRDRVSGIESLYWINLTETKFGEKKVMTISLSDFDVNKDLAPLKSSSDEKKEGGR